MKHGGDKQQYLVQQIENTHIKKFVFLWQQYKSRTHQQNETKYTDFYFTLEINIKTKLTITKLWVGGFNGKNKNQSSRNHRKFSYKITLCLYI